LTERGRAADEVAHDVEISTSFYMGIHEVTIGQWRAFVKGTSYRTEAEKDGQGGYGFNATAAQFEGRKPEYTWKNTGWAQTDAHPVVNVTWNDAVAFCQWLSTKEGKSYRLPTEAEWEYACRAGTTTRFYGGADEESLKTTANIADAALKAKWAVAPRAAAWDDGYPFTAPVGCFQANAFGLYDMHGNVYEWCQDWYGPYSPDAQRDPQGPHTGASRVRRGGCWFDNAKSSRAAFRVRNRPSYRDCNYGFRVVCNSR
jgi:sulfatase modifying factor 1